MKKILALLLLITFFAHANSIPAGHQLTRNEKEINAELTNIFATYGSYSEANPKKGSVKIIANGKDMPLVEYIQTNGYFEEYVRIVTNTNTAHGVPDATITGQYGRFINNHNQLVIDERIENNKNGKLTQVLVISFLLTKDANTFRLYLVHAFTDKTVTEVNDIFSAATQEHFLYIVASDGTTLSGKINLPLQRMSEATADVPVPFTTDTGEQGELVYDPVNKKITIREKS